MGTVLSAAMAILCLTALGQFALFFWRSLILTEAANPVSSSLSTAAGVYEEVLTGDDFQALETLDSMCPDLTEKRPKLGFVTTYFSAVRTIGSWLKPLSPTAASWTDAELASCARYAAVTLGQRLDRNQICAAALRSY